MVFRIQPHMRLHEWVADEAGFFRDEGLDYEFETGGFAAGTSTGGVTAPAGQELAQVLSGALEDMARGPPPTCGAPVALFQSAAVPSAEAVASRVPSGENAIPFTDPFKITARLPARHLDQ